MPDEVPDPGSRQQYPALLDTVLADSGITVVRSSVRIPRMNSIMER